MYEVVLFRECCGTVSTTLSLLDSQSPVFEFSLKPSNPLSKRYAELVKTINEKRKTDMAKPEHKIELMHQRKVKPQESNVKKVNDLNAQVKQKLHRISNQEQELKNQRNKGDMHKILKQKK